MRLRTLFAAVVVAAALASPVQGALDDAPSFGDALQHKDDTLGSLAAKFRQQTQALYDNLAHQKEEAVAKISAEEQESDDSRKVGESGKETKKKASAQEPNAGGATPQGSGSNSRGEGSSTQHRDSSSSKSNPKGAGNQHRTAQAANPNESRRRSIPAGVYPKPAEAAGADAQGKAEKPAKSQRDTAATQHEAPPHSSKSNPKGAGNQHRTAQAANPNESRRRTIPAGVYPKPAEAAGADRRRRTVPMYPQGKAEKPAKSRDTAATQHEAPQSQAASERSGGSAVQDTAAKQQGESTDDAGKAEVDEDQDADIRLFNQLAQAADAGDSEAFEQAVASTAPAQ